MNIDDETLMALSDGELDPARAASVQRAVDADPQLQARLRQFTETRRLLGALRAAPDHCAGEDPLAAMIRAASVKPASAAQAIVAPAPANLNRRPWLSAVASVALVVVGLAWWQWDSAGQGFSTSELAALDGMSSGQVLSLEGGGKLSMIASFRDSQGQLCREYETAQGGRLDTVLACRDQGSWQQRFAASANMDGDGYRPASGEAGVDAALEAIGAGLPLTPEEEAAALQG